MQRAQSWARTQLARKYKDKFQLYRKEELLKIRDFEGNNNSRASSRAKTRLVQEHHREYRDLHAEGVSLGYPKSWYTPKGGV